MLLPIILIVVAFAIYVVYTHSSITDKDGKIVKEAIVVTPKSVGIEVLDVSGLITGGAITGSKRAISWGAERNALGEASLEASGWKQSKGFTKGYDKATTATNNFIDTPFFTADSQ